MSHPKQYAVYIITNRREGALYIGVTSELLKRMWQHREGIYEGFSKRYELHLLIYYESFRLIENAIRREKQLKGWTRRKQLGLIESQNPVWEDLAANWF